MSSTILVVEDEPAIQELIAVNLSFAGHKVLRAFDAEQAQTLIRAELPDLILLDWMLPGPPACRWPASCATKSAPAPSRSSC